MNGKLVGSGIVISGLLMGAAVYYLQVYAFYEEVAAEAATVELTLVATGQPEPILAEDVQAIDGSSSPLRYRACFTTPHDHAMLTETYVVYEDPEPLTGPGWFSCYDAAEIGAALQAERAIAYLGQAEIGDGVDRVVAILDDGRGFVWHQLNDKFAD